MHTTANVPGKSWGVSVQGFCCQFLGFTGVAYRNTNLARGPTHAPPVANAQLQLSFRNVLGSPLSAHEWDL